MLYEASALPTKRGRMPYLFWVVFALSENIASAKILHENRRHRRTKSTANDFHVHFTIGIREIFIVLILVILRLCRQTEWAWSRPSGEAHGDGQGEAEGG